MSKLLEPVPLERPRAAGIVEAAAEHKSVSAVQRETIRVVPDRLGVLELILSCRQHHGVSKP